MDVHPTKNGINRYWPIPIYIRPGKSSNPIYYIYIYIYIYTCVYTWIWQFGMDQTCFTSLFYDCGDISLLRYGCKGHYHDGKNNIRRSASLPQDIYPLLPTSKGFRLFRTPTLLKWVRTLGRKTTSGDISYHFTEKANKQSLLWLCKPGFTDAKCVRVCVSDAKCCLNHGFIKTILASWIQKNSVVWKTIQLKSCDPWCHWWFDLPGHLRARCRGYFFSHCNLGRGFIQK